MIRLGTSTTRQDIKTDEPVSKPASTGMLIPVIALYLIIGVFAVLIGMKIAPVTNTALHVKDITAEVAKLEGEVKSLKIQIDQYEKAKAYINHKQQWAQTSLAGGKIMVDVFSALPQDVKLRGMNYEYHPGTQGGGSVTLQLHVRGTYEAGKLMAAVEQIDPRLVVSNKRPNLTEQGTEVQVEYQIK